MRKIGLAAALLVAACKAGTVATPDAAIVDGAADVPTTATLPDAFATDGFVMRPAQGYDGGTVPTVTITSGTRVVLATSQAVEPNGPSVPRGWLDRTRNEACQWEPAGESATPDGGALAAGEARVRCQPSDRTEVPAPVYTDQGCTALAFVRNAPAGCTVDPPPYVALPYAVCPSAWAIYQRGARVAATAAFVRSAGECKPAPALTAGQELWAIGAEIPAAAFQEGLRGADVASLPAMPSANGPRDFVLPIIVRGGDGSRAFDGWSAVTLTFNDGGAPTRSESYECTVGLASNGTLKCIPRVSVDVGTFYTDDACSDGNAVEAVPKAAPDCPRPRHVALAPTGTCPQGTDVLALGALSGGPYFARDSAGRCTPAAPSDTLDLLHRPSGPLSASMLPDAVAGVIDNVTRLRQRTETPGRSATASTAPVPGFFDTKLGVSCGGDTAADGSLRCLPGRTALGAVFSDPGCTVADVVVLGSPPDLGSYHCQASFAGSADVTATCGARHHVFPISASPYFGNLYRRGDQQQCVAVGASNGFTAYRIGPEIPFTDFGELKRL
jgi:hypothetical protein